MKDKRVGIIGVGNVGSTIAFSLASKGSCEEILLKDLRENFTKGIALDISQSASSLNSKTIIKQVKKDSDFKNCDVVVITAGVPRKPGMSRDELLFINSKIMSSIIENVIVYNKDAIIIVISNPLDVMVYSALSKSKWDRNKIIGMSGILDSSRMCHFIKEKVGPKKIKALVLGGHGDDMVPLINSTTIDDKPIVDILEKNDIEEIVEKTKNGGIEIVKLLETGSAYYAPAQSTVLMIEAILKDTKEVYPCAVLLNGEYGYSDVVTGVPIVLGKNGVEKIIEVNLDKKERDNLEKSINSVKNLIEKFNSNKEG